MSGPMLELLLQEKQHAGGLIKTDKGVFLGEKTQNIIRDH